MDNRTDLLASSEIINILIVLTVSAFVIAVVLSSFGYPQQIVEKREIKEQLDTYEAVTLLDIRNLLMYDKKSDYKVVEDGNKLNLDEQDYLTTTLYNIVNIDNEEKEVIIERIQ